VSRPLLYLEPVGGISGDMFLAAALDLGVSRTALEEGLRTLGLGDWRLVTSVAQRHGLSGVHLQVVVESPPPSGHRPLSEILRLVAASQLPERARARAAAVFQALGRVEASIHGVPLEAVAPPKLSLRRLLAPHIAPCGSHSTSCQREFRTPWRFDTMPSRRRIRRRSRYDPRQSR